MGEMILEPTMASGFDDYLHEFFSALAFVIGSWILIMYLLSLVLIAISLTYSYLRMNKPINAKSVFHEDLPGVSILRPLMGIEPLSEENLESLFKITYPKVFGILRWSFWLTACVLFELLLCAEDPNDPVIKLVEKLMHRYPNVDAHMIVGGGSPVLINPMVRNLVPGYEQAQYNLIWISTSRIKGSTEILSDMVARSVSTNTGIVHQLPFMCNSSGIGPLIEKVYFGTMFARCYLSINILKMNCVTGMSYLIKKPLLDDIGGLNHFGQFLAEDYFISTKLFEKGYRNALAAVPAQQNVSNCSVVSYKDRLVRWGRLRAEVMLFTTLVIEPCLEVIPLGLLGCWAVHHFFDINPYYWAIGHCSAFAVADYCQIRLLQNGPLTMSIPAFLIGWICRNLLAVWIYVEIFANRHNLTWGGRKFKVYYGGRTELVTEKGDFII